MLSIENEELRNILATLDVESTLAPSDRDRIKRALMAPVSRWSCIDAIRATNNVTEYGRQSYTRWFKYNHGRYNTFALIDTYRVQWYAK